ncbi:MAG: hypothetical protein LBQ14_07345 [Treponema sp.]|jgi:hypothetical protein|nr:hypothetical protein [Treponema sp.]
MTVGKDWLPSARTEILEMCRSWNEYMTAARRTAWGVPQDQYNELLGLFDAAQALMRKAMDEAVRTHVITVECQAAFKALKEKMRFFKDRYFKLFPLTEGDLAALGLKERDPPSPIARPEAQAEADITFPGIHLVELQNIRTVKGTVPDPRSDYGVRIYYGLSGPASEKFPFRITGTPKSGRDLPYSLFTRRKKERFDFDGESGNTVYFCLRYENSKGEAGPFGPVLSAVIP